MSGQTWRLDPIGPGRLAWLYLIPHAVDWHEPSAATEAAGYTITEEAQSLVDDQLGGCLRYLAVKAN
jgi:hypothetical protein